VVARSKASKKRQRRAKAHQKRAAHHEAAAAQRPHEHLPHSGTPEHEAYMLRRGREDMLAVGEFRRSRGPLPVIVGVVVWVLFALGVLAWVLLL